MLSSLYKRPCFFPLFKQFLETELTWESTNHYKRMPFQESELMFCVTLKGKSGINKINLTSIKKQRKLWIITVFLCQHMSPFSVCCLLW